MYFAGSMRLLNAANRLQVEGCGSEMLQIVCKWDIFWGKGPGYRQLGGAGGAAEPGTGNIYIYIYWEYLRIIIWPLSPQFPQMSTVRHLLSSPTLWSRDSHFGRLRVNQSIHTQQYPQKPPMNQLAIMYLSNVIKPSTTGFCPFLFLSFLHNSCLHVAALNDGQLRAKVGQHDGLRAISLYT